MKKFNNIKFKKEISAKDGVDSTEAKKLNCYVGVLLMAINFPPPGKGFSPKENFSPFISIGMSKHFVSGDYVSSDSVGTFFEAGFTYKKYGVKFVLDKSEVEFETTNGLKSINSYDTVVTLFTQF